MIYDIRLKISYKYDRPAIAGRHILRLMPADLPGVQRRLRGDLKIEPDPAERRDMLDFFQNAGVEIAFREAHKKIVFAVDARVERLSDAPSFDISPSLAQLPREISEYRGLDPQAPHHFLGPSSFASPTAPMTAYAQAILPDAVTAFRAVCMIGEALHRDMKYDPEATDVNTPHEEAFARRHGVCQDFAHIMIACLRGIGIPAGYVSGFLRTNPPPGKPRMEGADAMHAWVRAWCGFQTGWIEYDPTNAILVGTDHILIARGRDYGDVSPVKGVLKIAGEQKSDQAVDVIPVPEVVS
ncbi:transglutaminase family protein [Amaricoccus macauensis]|uniref:transglutaminase family protein n=1 Tax=Amaricoccus macauensis TaxID=57001 RepID=UPI003C7C3FE4